MNWKTVLAGVFLVALLLAATKSESLWIDEGDTAYYAVQPTFDAWKTHLLTDNNADCQFPLYMLGIWAWEKVTGSSEYALRSLNVVFALLTIASFALIGRQLRFPYLSALLLIQPFFWFYLNEARPYMLQIASGAVLLAGFVTLRERRGGGLGWGLFITGTILLYYATLLSFVTLGVFYTALGLLILRKEISLPRRWFWWGAFVALMIAPGALYYLQTVLKGAGGARIWAVSPLNFVWVYDEIIGGVGLGPPVWQIREIARGLLHSGFSPAAITPFLLAAILALGIASAFLLSAWNLITHPGRGRTFRILAAILGIIAISFAVMSVLLKKAFWARHLSPVFPVYVLLLYGALHFLIVGQKSVPRRILGYLLIGLLTLSSFQLVFLGTYSRDDYREAARKATETLRHGGIVWWAGSWHCGAYYHLPISEGSSTSDHLILIQDPTKEVLLSEPTPELILISRADVYDGHDTINAYASANGFHPGLPSPRLFHLWEK